ncbi:MAG: hypothetical protein ACX939_14110, partial [Hyphococcus sp.]
LMALPALYVAAELVENAFVAGFASGVLGVSEPLILVQQAATTIKFATGMPSMGLALAGVVMAAGAAILDLIRNRS